jgi:hypothetical protein
MTPTEHTTQRGFLVRLFRTAHDFWEAAAYDRPTSRTMREWFWVAAKPFAIGAAITALSLLAMAVIIVVGITPEQGTIVWSLLDSFNAAAAGVAQTLLFTSVIIAAKGLVRWGADSGEFTDLYGLLNGQSETQ